MARIFRLTISFLVAYSILGVLTVAIVDRAAAKKVFSRQAVIGIPERKAIEDSLVLFNKILTDIYVTEGDPKLIDEMAASKNVKHFIFRDVGFVGGKGMIMVLDQATMEVMSIEKEGDDLLARTFEEWNYSYQEAGTRKPLTEVKGLSQVYLYRLRKENGSWMVVSWDLDDSPPPAGKRGFLY